MKEILIKISIRHKLVLCSSLMFLMCLLSQGSFAQNVVVIVIDGARYTETFGAKSRYIPRMWNTLRPSGTIWMNFHNEGLTQTIPGHASVSTGTWQVIKNDGTERPSKPTMFEYFRRSTGLGDSAACAVVGKSKLDVLGYSVYPGHGATFGGRVFVAAGDLAVSDTLRSVLSRFHPRLTLVNLPNADLMAHAVGWTGYLDALETADSLVAEAWVYLQSDPFYKDHTILLVTNDHGRHDDAHGGFQHHGDGCEGCRHIMLLAIGGRFSRGFAVAQQRTQRDLLPSIAGFMGFPVPFVEGAGLLGDTITVGSVKMGVPIIQPVR